MEKVFASCAEAVADIPSGASIAVGGFGLNGIPHNLIEALLEQGATDLVTVSNNCGVDGWGLGRPARQQADSRERPDRTSARIASSSASISAANSKSSSCRRARSPSVCAPAAAAFRPSTRRPGDGTLVADGGLPWRYDADGSVAVASPKKETRVFNGREYVLEAGIVCDYALVRASVGDRSGNLVFHKATRNFNPLCAMAGKITIAEVEELVEPGAIDPENVHLAGHLRAAHRARRAARQAHRARHDAQARTEVKDMTWR